jgi:hypothetical protein
MIIDPDHPRSAPLPNNTMQTAIKEIPALVEVWLL